LSVVELAIDERLFLAVGTGFKGHYHCGEVVIVERVKSD